MTAEEVHQRINERGVTEKWAHFAREKLLSRLDQYSIGKTGDLARSIKYRVSPDRIRFEFNYYGKFIDMGVGKGVPIGQVKELKSVNSRALGIRTGRKAKKWYSRTMAGQIKKLTEVLAKEYSREMVDMVKANIQFPVIIEL